MTGPRGLRTSGRVSRAFGLGENLAPRGVTFEALRPSMFTSSPSFTRPNVWSDTWVTHTTMSSLERVDLDALMTKTVDSFVGIVNTPAKKTETPPMVYPLWALTADTALQYSDGTPVGPVPLTNARKPKVNMLPADNENGTVRPLGLRDTNKVIAFSLPGAEKALTRITGLYREGEKGALRLLNYLRSVELPDHISEELLTSSEEIDYRGNAHHPFLFAQILIEAIATRELMRIASGGDIHALNMISQPTADSGPQSSNPTIRRLRLLTQSGLNAARDKLIEEVRNNMNFAAFRELVDLSLSGDGEALQVVLETSEYYLNTEIETMEATMLEIGRALRILTESGEHRSRRLLNSKAGKAANHLLLETLCMYLSIDVNKIGVAQTILREMVERAAEDDVEYLYSIARRNAEISTIAVQALAAATRSRDTNAAGLAYSRLGALFNGTESDKHLAEQLRGLAAEGDLKAFKTLTSALLRIKSEAAKRVLDVLGEMFLKR